MDLTNLTLDDLLSQIKADINYVEPTPAKVSEAVENTLLQGETVNDFELTEVEKIEELKQPSEEEIYEPVAPEKEAEETPALDFEPIEEAYIPQMPAEALLENTPDSLSLKPEEEEEEETVEPPVFYAAQMPPFSEAQAPDITEEPADEPVSFFEPQAVLDDSQPLEFSDSENPEPETEPETEPSIYTAPTAQEAEEENFKIFGNINIDADISNFFPEIGEDPEAQSTEVTQAEEKTIVIEEFTDKTMVFERPGILTGKSLFEKTADLSAVPSIISADDALKDKYLNDQKTFIRTGAIPIVAAPAQQTLHQEPDDGQMILPGFGAHEEPVAQVDESTVEDELRRSRSKKVDSFKLEGVEPEEPQLDEKTFDELTENTKPKRKRFSTTKTRTRLNRQPVEYRKPSDKQQVTGFIRNKKLSALISLIISGLCTVALIITTAIPSVAKALDNSSFSFSVTAVISLALLTLAFLASLPCCSAGISCFFSGSGKPNSQTASVFAAFAAILQSLIVIIFGSDSDLPLFAAAGTLVLSLNAGGKLISFKRIAENFEFIASKSKNELYTVKTIENISDANIIGKNVVMGEADIRYSGKTKFVSNFLAYSMASDAADDLSVRLVPVVAAASALIGVIAGITTKDAVCGISLFAGAMCMGAPASAIIAASLPLSRANKKLRENGGIITGYAGAFEYESTNAVALDAADIFPGHCCNIHGMKTFYGVRMDDAILTAASMLITAGGPISSLFNEVVMGRKELLMNVEDIAYEDRLGLSGWVRGRRVFVGNRKLLENHNIEIPVSIDEAKYRHDGRRVIYLADAGKIAAIFVVSYGTDAATAEYLRKIENNGINLLISSTDSNITEEFVANAFGLPLNSVKIVSPNAAEVFKSYADDVSAKDDAKLVHSGKASSFLQCINAANILCWAAGVITTQQTFCCAAGLLLLACMVIFSGAAAVSALQICICQLVWLGIGIVVPLINKE